MGSITGSSNPEENTAGILPASPRERIFRDALYLIRSRASMLAGVDAVKIANDAIERADEVKNGPMASGIAEMLKQDQIEYEANRLRKGYGS